jgi:hypothetical protein
MTFTQHVYWRVAGWTFLKYTNTCAKILRTLLKPEYKEQALARDLYPIRIGHWSGGKLSHYSKYKATFIKLTPPIATLDVPMPTVVAKKK